jgi:hypothetical protein
MYGTFVVILKELHPVLSIDTTFAFKNTDYRQIEGVLRSLEQNHPC